jgi:AraC family transcriptional regulator, transcriptional activator FtrA
MRRHRVGVAVTSGAPLFELAVPCEIFGRHREGLPEPWYELRICAPAQVRTGAGFLPDAAYGYRALAYCDTVVVPAVADVRQAPPAELVSAVRSAHRRGARLVSLCTGAFVLAAAGVLDGRPATTHWMYADELTRRHPAVKVDPGVLYIDDGDVLTSAGTAAGIDLCLHIVRRDHGATLANTLARRLVVPAHRNGGQAQYIEAPTTDRPELSLAPLLDWMRAHLDEPLTVNALARRANLTRRTLMRHFHAATGSTPVQWLTAQRIHRARELLESSPIPVDQVARLCGLGSAANFRRHFTLAVGVNPSAYRRAFNGSAAGGSAARLAR